MVTHKTNRDRTSKAWKEFQKIREKIFRRDKFRCRICHISEAGSLRKFGRILEVHHIDGNEENNEESNLLTVCVKHHMELRYKNLSLFDKNQLQLTTWMDQE